MSCRPGQLTGAVTTTSAPKRALPTAAGPHPPVRTSCKPCAVKMTRPSVCFSGRRQIRLTTREKWGGSVILGGIGLRRKRRKDVTPCTRWQRAVSYQGVFHPGGQPATVGAGGQCNRCREAIHETCSRRKRCRRITSRPTPARSGRGSLQRVRGVNRVGVDGRCSRSTERPSSAASGSASGAPDTATTDTARGATSSESRLGYLVTFLDPAGGGRCLWRRNRVS